MASPRRGREGQREKARSKGMGSWEGLGEEEVGSMRKGLQKQEVGSKGTGTLEDAGGRRGLGEEET